MSTTLEQDLAEAEHDWSYATGSIHERMAAILGELPALGKDAYNEQQRFAYRSYDDVLNALNPLLAKYGVYVTPHVLERVANQRTTAQGKAMYEVNLHVEFTFRASDGSAVSASGWGEGTDLGDKATNKAMTGAFKYVLFQTFAISTEESTDSDASAPEETMAQAEGRQRREERTTETRAFDPGRDLIPGAIRVANEQDAISLRQAQRDLDPSQDWAAIETYYTIHTFGKAYDELDTPEKREFWTRFANAIANVEQASPAGTLPPPTAEQIRAAYSFAFKGVSLAIAEAVAEATGSDLTAQEGEAGTPASPEAEKPEEAASDDAA